jgi:hypothetical protein
MERGVQWDERPDIDHTNFGCKCPFDSCRSRHQCLFGRFSSCCLAGSKVSHFYRRAKRLRNLVSTSESKRPTLFLHSFILSFVHCHSSSIDTDPPIGGRTKSSQLFECIASRRDEYPPNPNPSHSFAISSIGTGWASRFRSFLIGRSVANLCDVADGDSLCTSNSKDDHSPLVAVILATAKYTTVQFPQPKDSQCGYQHTNRGGG